jgi:hypothetical protein
MDNPEKLATQGTQDEEKHKIFLFFQGTKLSEPSIQT